jgi:hypothetical protein
MHNTAMDREAGSIAAAAMPTTHHAKRYSALPDDAKYVITTLVALNPRS